MSVAPTIINVGYRSTNFWVVSAGRSRLMVDLGWPGMFSTLRAQLQRMDVPLREVTHGLATHYHMDHAGAAQDLKNQGMRLIVTPEQVPFIDRMKATMKEPDAYVKITLHDNVLVLCADSRAFLHSLGVDGEIVHTPGHSDDSVSLVLDSGACFTGDLTHPDFATEESIDIVAQSWQRLRALGATRVHPGHGPVRAI